MTPTLLHLRATRRHQTMNIRSTIPTARPTSQNSHKAMPPEAWTRLAWGILGFVIAVALSALAACIPQ